MMAAAMTPSPRSLKELLDGFSATEGGHNIIVYGLSIDSRDIEPGYLFVAVQGVSTHGKNYIDEAVKNGACAILIDVLDAPVNSSVPVIAIDDLQRVLSAIAGRFYRQPSARLPVYGITGTNGKTTCSHLLAQSLAIYEGACGLMGTLGYGVITAANDSSALSFTGMTTADAISTQKMCAQLLVSDARAMVMEVSSHGLVQHRVGDIDINTAVFTNLSHDHLDYHGSMQAYGQAKSRLFTMPSIAHAVINQNDDFSDTLVDKLDKNTRLISYSLSDTASRYPRAFAHFSLDQCVFSKQGVSAVLHAPEGVFPVSTKLVGAFNLSNLLAVIGALYANAYAIEKIIDVLPVLKPVPGRMELMANELGVQVVIDYAHTPDALESALEALAHHEHNSICCVFGCGGDRDAYKRPKMAAIAERLADRVIVTNDNPRSESPEKIFADIEQGFTTKQMRVEDRAEAIACAIASASKGDIVLIAGKGHEDYQVLAGETIEFSDQQQARLQLRKREGELSL